MSKSKTITINTTVCKKMKLSGSKVAYELEKHLVEQEKLRRFASKITKVPDTVRVYSTPNFTKSEDQ